MSKEYELEDKLKSTPKQKSSKIYKLKSSKTFSEVKTSSSSKVAKSSINFKKVTVHSFKHNAREEEKKANTIFEEFTKDNECDISSKEALTKFNDLYTKVKEDRLKRGINKTADKKNTLWEAVVNLKTEHKLNDVQELSKKIENITGFTTLQVAIHKDEGQEKEGKLIRKNHHAHISFFTLNLQTGQQLYRREFMDKKRLSILQDVVAKHLGMQRGISVDITKKKRLEHKEYKIYAKQKEAYEEKQKLLKQAIKNQIQKLKEIKATRPEYAKFEQINKELKSKIKSNDLTIDELKKKLKESYETISNQNKSLVEKSNKLKEYRDKEIDTKIFLNKEDIFKKRVKIKDGLFKTKEQYIYVNESVEEFVKNSKEKEKSLKETNDYLRKENSKLSDFIHDIKQHLNEFELDRLKLVIINSIPKVESKTNFYKYLNKNNDRER